MPSYKYLGVSEKQRDAMLYGRMKDAYPHEQRARAPMYKIDQKDSDEVKTQKRKRMEAWRAETEKQYRADIDGLDAKAVLKDSKGKLWEFPKGKAVEVPDKCSIIAKLEAICAEDAGETKQWEKVGAEKPTGEKAGGEKSHKPEKPEK